MMYEVEPLDDNNRVARVRVDGIEIEAIIDDPDIALIVGFGDETAGVDVGAFDGARLVIEDQPAGLVFHLFVPGQSTVDEFSEGAHLDVVTVQKDGKWFISIGYSILEVARQSGQFDGLPDPDFGRAFDLVDNQTGGTDSPEEVVQTLLNSLEALDYETVMRITDPLATPYVHDYQPLIDDSVDQQARRDAASDADLRIDEPSLEVSEWEGHTLVTFPALQGGADGIDFELDARTWCLDLNDGFDNERLCAEDGIAELLAEIDSTLDPRDFIPEQTGMIVIERNGRWYFDALGTIAYYTAQVAQVSADLTNDLNGGSPTSEFADFFAVEGPIARLGEPAVATAQSGAVAVAADLSAYPVLDTDSGPYQVAVARAVTDQPGTFVDRADIELDGEEWLVVFDQVGDDPELPAIGATTDGELDVELFEATVTQVGTEGFSGQLGGQGRPQIFQFNVSTSDGDLVIDGARAETIFPWEATGAVFDDPDSTNPFFSPGVFVVVTGEPNATFEIRFDEFAPEPEPEPEPEVVLEPEPDPELAFFDGAAVADRFDAVLADTEFFFVTDQPGGYFDDCGGPSDPDMTTYIWESDNATMVLTPFPSFERAAGAFDQLIFVQTPCDAFSAIEVLEIVEIDIDNIRFEWTLVDDPTTVFFEHHRLIGNNVVVAVDTSVEGLADQLALMDSFTG